MSLASSLRGNRIENWGAIASVAAPPNWQPYAQPARENAPQEMVTFTSPDNDGTMINFYFRGRPETPGASAYLAAALARGPHPLAKEELVQLRSVLGTNNVGSNQHTVFGERGTNDYPACNLSNANIISLNGRAVISVRCTFQDVNARPETEVQGIYFEQEKATGLIQQIYLEAPSLPLFLRYTPDYEAVLRSIVWN